MNLFSSQGGALLLFVVVLMQVLLLAEAIDLKSLFGKKNKEDSSPLREKKLARPEPIEGEPSNERAAANHDGLDDELEQMSAAARLQASRPRVNLAKIRAATADADRIAKEAAKRAPAQQENPMRPEDDFDPDDMPDHYSGHEHHQQSYEDQYQNRKPPTKIGRRRGKPVAGVQRFLHPERMHQEDPDHDPDEVEPEVYTNEDMVPAAMQRKIRAQEEAARRFVPTKGQKGPEDDKSLLRPAIRTRPKMPRNRLPFTALQEVKKPRSKLSIITGKVNKGLKQGFKQMAGVISEIPHYVGQASDSISAMLQLDNKGRLLALIEEVNQDIHFVRREFSKFSITWAPIMEKALNYLGDKDLDKIKWKNNDEIDFRMDALHSLVFGYEFMKLMMAWRENLLVAHEAYKLYLETIKKEIVDSKSAHVNVDENFIFQMRTVHAYMLLTSWLSVDELSLEPRKKLDHLMEIEDDRKKNYESEYFRNIIIMQELYEPTVAEFDAEEQQVEDTIGHAGALTEDFEDVEKFFDEFRNNLVEKDVKSIDWEVPQELQDFMKKLEPQLQFNPLVYSRSFKKDILEALQQAADERNSD